MSPSLIEDTYRETKEKFTDVPKKYRGSGVLEVETASGIDPHQVFRQIKKYKPAPLWRIYTDTKRYHTPKPITVKISHDEDFFFAENENLVVYGTGDTPEEAMNDFCLHIIYFFEYYKKLDESKVTGEALRLKELFANLLVEE